MHITIEKYTIPEGKTRYRTSDTTLLEFRRSILVKSEKTREVISGVTHITKSTTGLVKVTGKSLLKCGKLRQKEIVQLHI